MHPPVVALLGALPVALLALVVLRTRLTVAAGAWLAAAAGAGLAVRPYGLEAAGLAAGAAKGLWTGAWILLIVLPALLLYEVAERSGALERMAEALRVLAPTPGRRLLVAAWALPSFLQGAAGFGTPIAVAAPLLVRAGMAPVAAVAACLIGYHWAVTFGSMGSSFFVAAGTARLTEALTAEFAVRVAAILVINCLLAGLILVRRGGDREALRPALAIGAAMSGALVVTILVQPALGSTMAGLAGLAAAWVVVPQGGRRPDRRGLAGAAAPYLVLAVAVTIGFGLPGVRDVFERPSLAPAFPATEAAYGHVNDPVDAHQPFRPLAHPALYVLLSAGAGVLIYRRAGWWAAGTGRAVLTGWRTRAGPTTASILGLTVLAGLMVESGMVSALAELLSRGLGLAYLGVAAAVGAGGTVLTGSTTASNALLAPLQAGAATGLELPAAVLLAAQAAGGNVGNMLAPANIVVGAAAAGCSGREGEVIRATWKPALLLLAAVTAAVGLQVVLAP